VNFIQFLSFHLFEKYLNGQLQMEDIEIEATGKGKTYMIYKPDVQIVLSSSKGEWHSAYCLLLFYYL
jgi:hypothetical protein